MPRSAGSTPAADALGVARAAPERSGAEVAALAGDVADRWHRGTLVEAAGERIDLLAQQRHLLMLEAVGGRALVGASYRGAQRAGHVWHEFGDVHLIAP